MFQNMVYWPTVYRTGAFTNEENWKACAKQSSEVGKYFFESIVHWFVSFIRLIGVSETNESIGNEVLKEPISKTGMAAIISIELVFLHSPKKKLVFLMTKSIQLIWCCYCSWTPFRYFAWKLPKLKVVRIESFQNWSCQYWKLLKLKVATIEKLPKLSKLKIAKVVKLPKLKIDKIVKIGNCYVIKLPIYKLAIMERIPFVLVLFLIHINGGRSVVHLEYVDWKIKWKIK